MSSSLLPSVRRPVLRAPRSRATRASTPRLTSKARRVPICVSPRLDHRASRSCGCHNPCFDQDGYDSTHTIVEIVTDDMPFLVDSVAMALTRHGLGIHLVVHPIIPVRRDDKGQLLDFAEGSDTVVNEAFIHFEVDRETDPTVMADLRADLLKVFAMCAPRSTTGMPCGRRRSRSHDR